ncbi:Rossmann-like and DUF2520 domain-containing protein [Microbulbifer elongatus]|uniref:Rossmann-like and DUF2520 domain-containing protein n=1 Tax=Microbulbifer elongatus TaxID=86173 RepID=UPI001E466DE9|nr:Rossmann-like and DUF2520 domain-containing protein [Microbulbifer elongatus]
MHTLNIIGAGKLGQTLAALWHRRGTFTIGGILNRRRESAARAQAFIGAGTVIDTLAQMPAADLWLLAVPDDQIAATAAALAPVLRGQNTPPLVFHCSGALPASILSPCGTPRVASAHPVHSFADPQRSLRDMPGATVALEGAPEALATLAPAFQALDCSCLHLDAEQKVLYHTGSVIACNYLTVLLEQSLQVFAAAGIDRQTAAQMLQPIVLQTARNNFALGPEQALTGPLVRGDRATVARQIEALDKTLPDTAAVYRTLGLAALPLAKRAGLSEDARRQIQSLLDEPLS